MMSHLMNWSPVGSGAAVDSSARRQAIDICSVLPQWITVAAQQITNEQDTLKLNLNSGQKRGPDES